MLAVSYFMLLCYFVVFSKASWFLGWSDEFTSDRVDLTRWDFELYDGCHLSNDLCGWGNQELQWYTNSSDNIVLKDGHMIIKAVQKEGKYTSTRIKTEGRGDWSVAKIEIRAKFPRGDHVTPSIWMLPTSNIFSIWPSSGAIDIAVMKNFESPYALYCGVMYGRLYNDLDEKIHRFPMFNLETPEFYYDFHVFTLEKLKDELKWFIDGHQVYNLTRSDLRQDFIYPFNERFHLVFSLSVGGKLGGEPTETTVFPQLFEFDYVRVYYWNENTVLE